MTKFTCFAILSAAASQIGGFFATSAFNYFAKCHSNYIKTAVLFTALPLRMSKMNSHASRNTIEGYYMLLLYNFF